MYQQFLLALATAFLMACAIPATAQQQVDKIQRAINSTKEVYDNETRDYITDGQRTVWVKSYKKWTPADFPTLKKEAPHILKFLREAITRNRLDVLEQLLPDYYRYRGGVKQFAEDIENIK